MIMRRGLAALVPVLLLGCQTTPPETQWSKAGATTEDVKRDLYWCTVQRRHRSFVQQSPADARPPERVVDEACMEGRGYAKVDSKS